MAKKSSTAISSVYASSIFCASLKNNRMAESKQLTWLMWCSISSKTMVGSLVDMRTRAENCDGVWFVCSAKRMRQVTLAKVLA